MVVAFFTLSLRNSSGWMHRCRLPQADACQSNDSRSHILTRNSLCCQSPGSSLLGVHVAIGSGSLQSLLSSPCWNPHHRGLPELGRAPRFSHLRCTRKPPLRTRTTGGPKRRPAQTGGGKALRIQPEDAHLGS